MTGGLMAAEMASQPEVLARLVARAPADTAAVQAVVPRPLAGVVFLARGSSVGPQQAAARPIEQDDRASLFLVRVAGHHPASTPATTPTSTGMGT